MNNFESVFDKHKEELTRSLVFFGEGNRVNKILVDEERKRPDYYNFYEDGVQSQQQKIDELKRCIDDVVKYILINQVEGEDAEFSGKVVNLIETDKLLELLKG